MASTIFTFFCNLGLRDELIKSYAFRPCLPYYLLRSPHYEEWKEGKGKYEKVQVS